MAAVSNQRAIGLLLEHVDKTPLPRGMDSKPGEVEARFGLSYLNAFGYLKDELSQWKDINLGDIVEAVKQFQGMFGQRRDGKFTHATVRAMQKPRCGMPDVLREHLSQHARVRNWARGMLAAWKKRGLRYGIVAYVGGIDKSVQKGIIQAAYDDWCRVANIGVVETSNNEADIVIGTGQGQKDNFDGPSGVLAWAYLPDGNDQQLQMRFDLDETWVTDPGQRGILLKNVATHEFGHTLGLDHSKVQQALMAPFYAVGITSPQQNDDIPRIVARYGQRTSPWQGGGGGGTPPGTSHTLTLQTQGEVSVTIDGRKIV
jgi:hypothetical protein